MDYLRGVFDLRRIRLLISGGVSLLLGLLIVLISNKVAHKLDDQYLASRWSKDNDYVQASVFLSELADFENDSIKEFEYKVSNRLKQDSLMTDNENARLWIYAYSAGGKVSVSTESNTVDVKAYGVGGDFFLFHPLTFAEGSFFGEDANKDLVVIDTDTAWKLFGSNNVVGQVVEIGGVRHIVTGVVKKDEGRLNDIAGNAEPIIFLSYESLAANGNITYINTVEALMPNPITNYACSVLEELVPADKERFSVVQNTGRFNWVSLLKNVKNFGTRGMNGKSIVYPYWENLARGYEDYLTPICVLGCLLFLYPCGLLLYIFARMWKKRTIHGSDLKTFIEDWIEDYRERKEKRKEREVEIEEIL